MRNRTIPPLSQEKIDLFWSRVQIGNPDECWPWIAARSSMNKVPTYGAFCPNLTQTFPSHRIAYFLATGDDPIGFVVMHKCDNPPCCNPAHLKKGTIADNNKDAKQKGRTALGDRNAARLYPEKWQKGEQHWTRRYPERIARGQKSGMYTHPEKIRHGSSSHLSRLTEAQVLGIREEYAHGSRPIDLARKYNVQDGTIQFIIQRKTWKHI